MAIYTCLPVYKVSYDLLLEIFKFTKNLSREYRYTLGEDIKKETIELIINVYRANKSYSKKEFIQGARENTEIIRLLIRISKDLKLVSLKRFVGLNEKIESISKQLAAWDRAKS